MIKQLAKMGLLFLRTIGLVEAKVLRIGYGKNNDIGLIQIRQRNTHKQLQIGEIG